MLDIVFFDENGLDIVVPFPHDWDEMTLPELRIISEVLQVNGPKSEIVYRIIEYRLSINPSIPSGLIYKLDQEDLMIEFMPLLDYWLETVTLTRMPFPALLGLTAPMDDTDDLYCGEYEDCEAQITLFMETQDYECLRRVVSILFRPTTFKGRVKYRDYEPSLSFFKDIDNTTLHIVYLWWIGCRHSLIALFSDVFSAPLPSDGEDAAVESDGVGMMTAILHASAGERNGTRQQIKDDVLVKELLYDCSLQIESSRKLTENGNG